LWKAGYTACREQPHSLSSEIQGSNALLVSDRGWRDAFCCETYPSRSVYLCLAFPAVRGWEHKHREPCKPVLGSVSSSTTAPVRGNCSLSISGVRRAAARSCTGVFACRRPLASAGSSVRGYGTAGDGGAGLAFQWERRAVGQLFRWCGILTLPGQKGIRCPASDANHMQSASGGGRMFRV